MGDFCAAVVKSETRCKRSEWKECFENIHVDGEQEKGGTKLNGHLETRKGFIVDRVFLEQMQYICSWE